MTSRSPSSSPPTSPKAGVLRLFRKSTDVAQDDRPKLVKTKTSDSSMEWTGFRARFKRASKVPEPVSAVQEDDGLAEADAALTVAEDHSAHEVGLPNGTRFVESETISRSLSRRTAASSKERTEVEGGITPVAAMFAHPQIGTTLQRSLAHKIQNLLSSVPPFYGLIIPGQVDPAETARAADDTASDAPGDANLLEQLSNTTLMSGTWAVLDRLLTGNSKDEADTGLMVYGPLIIDANSKVELARSSVVELSVEVVEEIHHSAARSNKPWWPLGGAQDGGLGATEETIERKRSIVVQEVKVYYPSLTKISLKCTWWGFRIYLPPPVMLVLDQESLEAAQRAAMITTALTWLVNNVPAGSLPAPLAVVFTMLKAIVPIIGYLAGFIGWSWGQIKSFDKGNGVVLSATWLLPIALIPGAWDAPTTPPPPEPEATPAPQPAPTPAPVETPTPPVGAPVPAPAPPAPAPAPAPVPTDPPATNPVPTDPVATLPPAAPPTSEPVAPAEKKKRGWFGKK